MGAIYLHHRIGDLEKTAADIAKDLKLHHRIGDLEIVCAALHHV